MLDRVCEDCHQPGSPEVRLAATFKSMYTKASDDVDGAEKLVEEAARIPLYVDDYKARLADARTALMEVGPGHARPRLDAGGDRTRATRMRSRRR